MAEQWQATLCGLAMDGTPDASGVVWGIEQIEGWDSADVISSDREATGRDGNWGPAARFGGRPLTLKGWADCPSMATAFAARDQLPTLTDGTLVVHESVEKQIEVERGGIIRYTDPIDSPGLITVAWQIPVKARYPFKRALSATTVTVAAGATVSHTAPGTVAAEIEVTCTTTGTVDLTIGGLRLRTGSLNAGVKLTSGPGFTNPKRTIISSTGVNLFGLIVQPMQWPAISPGVNSIHQAGTANLSIRYFPSYA